jgi:hypothetical protein
LNTHPQQPAEAIPFLFASPLAFEARAAEAITVESRVSSRSCRMGQELVWTSLIRWRGKAADHRIEALQLPDFAGFAVVAHRTSDGVSLKDGISEFSRRDEISLRPKAPGELTIEPATVEVLDGSNQRRPYRTGTVTVSVGQSLGRVVAIGTGCFALVAGLVLVASAARQRPQKPQTAPIDETRDFDHLMRAPNHREFYLRALELLRTGFGRRLGTTLPASQEPFIQALKELGARDTIVHLADQLCREFDEGRFNPDTLSGKDRDRLVFQIQDLFRELEGRRQVD